MNKDLKPTEEVGYRFRSFYIPKRMMYDIERYTNNRVLPGQFLQAIISNNLREACARADDENLQNLPAYVAYFYNRAPNGCWGSREIMNRWVANEN